ncbi:MAG: hypothetical protein R3B47_10665 [Bacteroidia bacterium]
MPIALMGFDNAWFLTVVGINLVYQFWIYTEAINRFPPWIEFVFNTPSPPPRTTGETPNTSTKTTRACLSSGTGYLALFSKEEENPTRHHNAHQQLEPGLCTGAAFRHDLMRSGKDERAENKFRLLFNKPGWYLEELGGYRAPQAVDHSAHHKFDLRISPKLNYYLLSQYIILLGITAFFVSGLLLPLRFKPGLAAGLYSGRAESGLVV